MMIVYMESHGCTEVYQTTHNRDFADRMVARLQRMGVHSWWAFA
jgi:hypothetical protein